MPCGAPSACFASSNTAHSNCRFSLASSHTLSAASDDLIKSRANALRHAIRKAGADRDAQLRHVVVENHSRCKRNDEGELVLGNGKRWLVDLMEGVRL